MMQAARQIRIASLEFGSRENFSRGNSVNVIDLILKKSSKKQHTLLIRQDSI